MLEDLLPSDALFIFRPQTLYNNQGHFDLEKLNPLKQYRRIFLNYASEHWGEGNAEWADSNLKDHLNNYTILSYNPNDHGKFNTVFYPYWYHKSIKMSPKDIAYVNVEILEKKYFLSCLNGNVKTPRIINYLSIKEKPWFDRCFFSMHQPNPNPNHGDFDYALPDAFKEQWDNIKNTFPPSSYMNIIAPTGFELDQPAYADSYINLVTESKMLDNVFVTEKTWKPIANGQLFLIIGCPRTIEHLKDQGIDTFDDIIDHKYYDNESDWFIRIQRVHQLLDDLINQDLLKIYKQTYLRRKKNVRKFFSGDFDQQYQQQCINMLN